MLYLDPTLGAEPSVILIPTPNGAELIDAASDSSVPRKFMGAHLVLLLDESDVSSDAVGAALRRVGARFGSIEGKVTEIADIGADGEFVAKAIIVESPTLEQIYNQTINALLDAEIAIDEAKEISLHIPVSVNAAIKTDDLNSLIGQTLKFDHFGVTGNTDSVTYRLEGSDDDVDKFYISSRRSDCDGYALLRSKDDGLVSCHANKTDADEALRKLVENTAEERSSSLVRLSNNGNIIDLEGDESMTTFSSTIVTNEFAEETALVVEPIETFNIVPSESMGSLPLARAASAAQMEKLLSKMASAEPELEGPAIMTGVESGDRRFIHQMAFVNADGSLNTRQLPLPYMFGDERAEMHQKARLGGWIVSIEVVPTDTQGNYALFTKTKLLESEFGGEIYTRFDNGEYRGVSADLDRVRMVELEAGSTIDGGYLRVLLAARFMGMTAVNFPALEEAGLWLTGDQLVLPEEEDYMESGLVASGGSSHPELQVVSLLSGTQKI